MAAEHSKNFQIIIIAKTKQKKINATYNSVARNLGLVCLPLNYLFGIVINGQAVKCIKRKVK